MQDKVFIIIIYENPKYEQPIFKSSKPISEEEYKELFSMVSVFVYDVFKVKWSILERRFFKEEINGIWHYKVIIDGEKM